MFLLFFHLLMERFFFNIYNIIDYIVVYPLKVCEFHHRNYYFRFRLTATTIMQMQMMSGI